MTRYITKIAPNAYKNIERIIDYITYNLSAPDTALHFIDLFEQAINDLAIFPEKHPLIDDAPWKSRGIRKTYVKNFYIYYWIDYSRLTVHVISVLHSTQNQNDFFY